MSDAFANRALAAAKGADAQTAPLIRLVLKELAQ